MMVKFTDLTHLLRRLEDCVADGSRIKGYLTIDSAETLTCLSTCDADYEVTGIDLGGAESAELAVGVRIAVAFDAPRANFGFVKWNVDGLLTAPGARVHEPTNYFLLDVKFASQDPVADSSDIARYRKVLELIQTLKACAAYLDERQQVLIFVRDGKYEVPVTYAAQDLAPLDVSGLDSLMKVIPQDLHKSQIEALLAEVIYEMTSAIAAPLRFKHLLGHLDEAREKLARACRMYTAGFSYEKIKSDVESARIEFTGKIHKVFSDIQNQLLGIPVATIIVATQMKPHTAINADFWISVAVLLGSMVFAVLVHFLLRNQKHTLEVVGLEIERQEAEVLKQPEEIIASFLATFKLLRERYKAQLRILIAIDWLLLGGVLLSIFFFCQVSEPTRAWFETLFQ